MAVRRESVVLELDDRFSTKMARAAATTAVLGKELDRLDGKRVFDDTAKSADDAGKATERASKQTKEYSLQQAIADEKASRLRKSLREQAAAALDAEAGLDRLDGGLEKFNARADRGELSIDKYSGRLQALMDLALVGGPALLRFGAGVLPAVSAGIVGIGAAAGGIAVTALAVSGLKDGLKALNDYELERTPENLQKVRVELEKLGPDGAHFVQYLDDLGPVLERVQNIARHGVLPGFEESIDDAQTRLPIVQKIVERLSETVGDLAADTGAAIASDRLSPFLKYIRDEGAPALDAFARSTGNVALGLANILVAVDPATQDFLDGMVNGTERFARATEHLDENKGFQDFLHEVREAGPEVADFLGSAIDLMGGLARASAPVGRVVLPALTKMADLLAAVGNSPFGPALYTGFTALTVFGRGVDVVQKRLDSLKTSGDRTGTSLSMIATRAAGIAAVAVAVGTLTDNMNRIDPTKLDASLTALERGEVTDTVDKVIDSIQQLNSPLNKIDLGELVHLGGLAGDTSLDKFANNIDQVDKSLAQLVDSGNGDQAADLFQRISDLAADKGIDPSKTADRFDDYALAIRNAAAAVDDGAGLLRLFGAAARDTGDDLNYGADGAQAFSDALAGLNGWLDKREALRSYRDGLAGLAKGFKDGFGRQDVENIDAVGRSISQVAATIKDRGIRADFLAGARASLEDLANRSGPKAQAEIKELIGALDRYGLTKPKSPKLDADDAPARGKVKNLNSFLSALVGHPYNAKLDADDKPARRKGQNLNTFLSALVGHPYTAKVNADTGQAVNEVRTLSAALSRIVSKTITVTVNKAGNALGKFDWDTGGYTGPGHRLEPRGVVHAGEVVIPQTYVKRDWSMLKSRYGDLPGFAGGGVVGDSEDKMSTSEKKPPRRPVDLFLSPFIAEITEGTHGLKEFTHSLNVAQKQTEKASKQAEKAVDKATAAAEKQSSKLDELTSAMGSLASTVSSKFDVDLGSTDSTKNPWSPSSSQSTLSGQIASATAQATAMPAIIAALKAAGLTGPALAEVLTEMSPEQLQALAAGPADQIAALNTGLTSLNAAKDVAAGAAGNAVWGQAVAAQTLVAERSQAILADSEQHQRDMKQRLNQIEAAVHGVEQAIKTADANNKQGHNDNAQQVTAGVSGAAARGKDHRVYGHGGPR